MKAMIVTKVSAFSEQPNPLQLVELPDPVPSPGDVVIRVTVCGVCHTELDEIEGRTPPSRFPMVLGHQVVGRVVSRGNNVTQFREGDRVGVAWIYRACGQCSYCQSDQENLCPQFLATGRDAYGGYAEMMTIPADYAYMVPEQLDDAEVAPLLCAGAIGYRALRLTGLQKTGRLGLMGFGASGHLVLKFVRAHCPQMEVYVFSRNSAEREFAGELGAVWTGDIAESPPILLDAIIDTTPVWRPVVESLRYLRPGGRLVINAIRKEDVDKQELLRLYYPEHLWLEKEIKSVANVTRRDVQEFLDLAASAGIRPAVREYPFDQANQALQDLKYGRTPGAKVLRISY